MESRSTRTGEEEDGVCRILQTAVGAEIVPTRSPHISTPASLLDHHRPWATLLHPAGCLRHQAREDFRADHLHLHKVTEAHHHRREDHLKTTIREEDSITVAVGHTTSLQTLTDSTEVPEEEEEEEAITTSHVVAAVVVEEEAIVVRALHLDEATTMGDISFHLEELHMAIWLFTSCIFDLESSSPSTLKLWV